MSESKRNIEVVDYRFEWKNLYLQEAKHLKECLDKAIKAIHHIGSTSVPGLAAKPIIDILIEAYSLELIDKQNRNMKGLDYLPLGERGITGRRFYIKGNAQRTHHIHIFLAGTDHCIRHLAFRDYLHAHKDVADAYAQLKREVVQSCDNDIERYCQGKASFIQHYEALAIQWYSTNKH